MTPTAFPSLNPVYEPFASPLLGLGNPALDMVLRLRLAGRHENIGLAQPVNPSPPPNFGYGYIIH